MDEKPLGEGRAEAGVGRDGRAPAEGDSRGRWGFLDCNPTMEIVTRFDAPHKGCAA